MINTGYIFSKDSSRIFINTSLGCSSNCSYCYLHKLKYSKGKRLDNYVDSNYIIEEIEKYDEYKKGINGSLISFGCFSECFDDKNKKQTLKLLEYFINNGNKIQLSTKKYIDYNELVKIKKLIKYDNQLTIFTSCASISNRDIEDKTDSLDIRFKNFLIKDKLDIPVVLYIKPVIKDITIKDIEEFKHIIIKYNIKDVVVGSMIDSNGLGDIAPFINDDSLHYNSINDEDIIYNELSKICNVYKRSLEVIYK